VSRLLELIEEELKKDLELLKELEDTRRYETRPIRRRKYDAQIQQLKQTI